MALRWPHKGLCVSPCAMAARSFATSVCLVLFGLTAAPPAARSQLNINFTYAADTDARAVAGFQQAAARWSTRLNDPITINLSIGFRGLGSSVLGQANISFV